MLEHCQHGYPGGQFCDHGPVGKAYIIHVSWRTVTVTARDLEMACDLAVQASRHAFPGRLALVRSPDDSERAYVRIPTTAE